MEDDDVEHADEFPILMNLGDGGQAQYSPFHLVYI
jgi:hypothetical protein